MPQACLPASLAISSSRRTPSYTPVKRSIRAAKLLPLLSREYDVRHKSQIESYKWECSQ